MSLGQHPKDTKEKEQMNAGAFIKKSACLTGFPECRRQRWNSKKLESCEAKKTRVCRTDPERRDLQGEIVLGFFTSSPLYLQMSKKQQHG